MVTVSVKDTILAQSDKPVKLESSDYFPPESVNKDAFFESPTTYTCPWKGHATYYSANVNGATLPDVAWAYLQPKPAAAQIAGHFAFDKARHLYVSGVHYI
ncbi:uncharacterized protein PHACADRAFT_188621 [Phanerochaete carnosa HHB-10118-sp]|uniref:DUF427 domain-containing protein n=1 Tax=Phanerochaete carnosa (strain HHB-10118-sp) TaxID=650164 RepID=K5VRX7_PHACS|nr:uncharacterized protein PHACADRAFT_188621 [Phanerochaete carnosa HHB-10118-sp]EKM49525.1 hypothetical protein PHACADRAFT_188621 [Phanerochaete carnosa HHB-10118-sp]